MQSKQFLMAVAWTSLEKEETRKEKVTIDTSGWVLDAVDGEDLTRQLRDHIVESCTSVSEVVGLFNFEDKAGARLEAGFFEIR